MIWVCIGYSVHNISMVLIILMIIINKHIPVFDETTDITY